MRVYLYPRGGGRPQEFAVRTLKAVYDLYPPRHRTLAASGEGALVNGAWPKAKRQSFENIHDKDDIWTGLEYQAACDMINEGLLQEALIVLRAIDERYDARKRNPWNEVECGDHYARAMASWGVLIGLSGFHHILPDAVNRIFPFWGTVPGISGFQKQLKMAVDVVSVLI